ncbi:hypothetical protein ACPA9J_19945 [Pseudomonas aeruginosa]
MRANSLATRLAGGTTYRPSHRPFAGRPFHRRRAEHQGRDRLGTSTVRSRPTSSMRCGPLAAFNNAQDHFISHVHVGSAEAYYLPVKMTTATAWQNPVRPLPVHRAGAQYNPAGKDEWQVSMSPTSNACLSATAPTPTAA